MLRLSITVVITVWLMASTNKASDLKNSLEYDTNVAPLNESTTTTNHIVGQVKKIVQNLRLKAGTTLEHLTKPMNPWKFKGTTTTTVKPLFVNKSDVVVDSTKLEEMQTTTEIYQRYYGALSPRFRLDSYMEPEILVN